MHTHGFDEEAQGRLFLHIVDLIEEGQKVTPPEGVVFSTHPRRSLASDGNSYFVKGPDLNIVVPEVIGHLLARKINLRVPDFALARQEQQDGFLFASREVRGFRAVDLFLAANRVQNPEMIQQMHLFDVLIANRDRNIGNLIGEEVRGQNDSRPLLVAIDFEKAEAFRGQYPLATVPTIEPSRLRPSGILGDILRLNHNPDGHLAAVEAIVESDVLDAFGKLEAAIGRPIEWKQSSAQLIVGRAQHIQNVLSEVWR